MTTVTLERSGLRDQTRGGSVAQVIDAGEDARVDVVVEVGGWEHACCGSAIERNQIVDLGCVRFRNPELGVDLVKTSHDMEPDVRVRGRVRDISVARPDRPAQPVLRLPSGKALRGFDDHDDGHLEDPWTGELLPRGDTFLVVVDTGRTPTSAEV